jgi:hypothetical protein
VGLWKQRREESRVRLEGREGERKKKDVLHVLSELIVNIGSLSVSKAASVSKRRG